MMNRQAKVLKQLAEKHPWDNNPWVPTPEERTRNFLKKNRNLQIKELYNKQDRKNRDYEQLKESLRRKW